MVKSWREACGLHTGTDTKQPLVSECKIKVKESSAEISLSLYLLSSKVIFVTISHSRKHGNCILYVYRPTSTDWWNYSYILLPWRWLYTKQKYLKKRVLLLLLLSVQCFSKFIISLNLINCNSETLLNFWIK